MDTLRNESRNKEEEKAQFNGFLENFDISSIDVTGYPDHLDY